MASSYTSNYQLCQWEATDKVLRTDFNGDNQKIDAALAGLAEELEEGFAEHAATLAGHTAALNQHAQQLEDLGEKATAKRLLSGSVSQSGLQSFTIPLSSVDWDEWKAVYVTVEGYTDGSGGYLFYVNGNDDDPQLAGAEANRTDIPAGPAKWACLVFLPLYDGGRQAQGYPLGCSPSDYFSTGCTFNSITSLLVKFGDGLGRYFQSGSKYEVWGEK